jgi:hypothetical protein
MVHGICDRVTLIDLLMLQSPYGQEGNEMTFQDGASKCQLKQKKHDIHS